MANLRADNLTGTGGRNAIDGSLFFEGESSYLEMASGALISGTGFGTNDFTIEFWINQGVNASNYTILFAYTSSTNLDRFEVAMHSSTIQVYTDTGAWRDTSYAPASGQWEHIAFVRNYSGNTLKMYANGVEKWSVSNNHDYNEAGVTQIGSYGSASYGYFEGFISNLRVVNGTALYTAAFTPPTEKLKPIDGTVLLCCQDSDNALQEATGKTITGYGRYLAATGEKFANTGFSADSDWTKGSGWTIANDVATHAQGTAGDLYQSVSGLVIGQTYKLSVDIVTSDQDVSYFYIDNNPGGNYPPLGNGSDTLVGHNQIFFDANATTMNIGFRGSSLWAGTLTNLRLSSADYGKAPKVLPPVGVDEGVTFGGETKHNTQNYMYFPTGDTSQRSRGRCIISNGSPGSQSLYYLQMQSGGIVQNFGLLANNVQLSRACGSSTRMLVADGYIAPATTNVIEYITIATTGTGTNFGELTVARRRALGMSNTTRGVWVGGTGASPAALYYNEQDYNTIATLGDATDFGDASTLTSTGNGVSSSTRGVYSIAYNGSTSAYNNTLEYITFATTGSRTSFGELNAAKGYHMCGCSSSDSTRGLFAGGYNPSNNNIDYITMASTGNATDFGDLTVARRSGMVTGNSINAIFVGGYIPGASNTIDKVTIQTTGNAVDLGDLTVKFHEGACSSDSHGGLS